MQQMCNLHIHSTAYVSAIGSHVKWRKWRYNMVQIRLQMAFPSVANGIYKFHLQMDVLPFIYGFCRNINFQNDQKSEKK